MLKVTPALEVGQLRDTTLEGEKLLESYLRDFISANHQLVLEEIGESGLNFPAAGAIRARYRPRSDRSPWHRYGRRSRHHRA